MATFSIRTKLTERGAKGYFVYRRVNGQQVKFTFRRFGEVPLAQARGEAEQLFAKMGGGVNPIEERRKAREEAKRKQASGVALRAGIDLYEGTLRAKGRASRTIEDYRYLIEKYLADWLDRPLAEITRADVRKRHADIPL